MEGRIAKTMNKSHMKALKVIKLSLPFPPKELSPNSRVHWAKKVKFKAAQRTAGFYAAYPHRGKIPAGPIAIKFIFHPPTHRRMDLDNCLARLKAAADGIASGLGVDDNLFRPITCDMGEPDAKNPHVIVEIG